ncbi:hypothetical protein ACS0TY_015538 [Phlomoides rotata]
MSHFEGEDRWIWKLEKEGNYSVKTTYNAILKRTMTMNSEQEKISVIWNKIVPLKIVAFSWKLVQDKVPTMTNLLRRGAINPYFSLLCRLCGRSNEDSDHLFFECTSSVAIWEKVYKWFHLNYRNAAI